MLALWGHQCAVSGCAVPEALRASHAKPWRHSAPARQSKLTRPSQNPKDGEDRV
ncbi:HNH endonuclease [Caballeronia udeis]|uniref:HNH endonuclease n=1 Tax=Caballeronia udeis TaxID=1232866 RepID=UPI0038B2BE74